MIKWYKVGSFYHSTEGDRQVWRIALADGTWHLLRWGYGTIGNYPTLKVAKEVAEYVLRKEKRKR